MLLGTPILYFDVFLTKYQSYEILEKLTKYKNISVVDDYPVHNVVLQEKKNGI